MKNEAKLTLCRKYYFGGFVCLPFLWCINAIWFFKEAFSAPPFPQQAKIKQYVIRSGIGAVLWLAVIITWIVIFQVNRAAWGATADYMSFIIPKGIPWGPLQCTYSAQYIVYTSVVWITGSRINVWKRIHVSRGLLLWRVLVQGTFTLFSQGTTLNR